MIERQTSYRFDWDDFGSVISMLCRERCITQRDLARAVQITPKHMSQIVTGKVSPRVSLAQRICRQLDVTLAFELAEDSRRTASDQIRK